MVPVGAHLIQEHHLVGEDVGRIAAVVVEIAQFGIQKTRRPGRGNHPGRIDLGDVLASAVHSALPFLGAERFLGARRHVVDHWIPDGSGVLQQMHIDMSELRRQHIQIHRPGVVHVEGRRRAVGHHQSRISDRSVRGCPQGDDHDVEFAFGPADLVLDRVAGLDEPVKT